MRARPGLGAGEALRLALPAFVAGKLLTVGVVVLSAAHGSAASPDGVGLPGWEGLRGAFAFWDGASYLQIAEHGYPDNSDPTPGAAAHVWAFMPGYPVLIAAAAVVLRDTILSGLVVGAACELVALTFTARLVAAERDVEAARFATWLLALVPYGVFLSVVYTESAFLAAAAASLHLMRQGRFAAASLAAALATAVRVTGLALLPALIVEYVVRHRRRPARDAASLLLAPLPLVLFCLYAAAHAHDLLAFFHIEASASFHRQLTNPLDGLRATWETATGASGSRSNAWIFLLELVWGLMGLATCIALWASRGVAASLATYASVVWALAVSQPYWLSVGRYETAMLPALLLVVDVVGRRESARMAVLVTSCAYMCCLATLFAQGAFVG